MVATMADNLAHNLFDSRQIQMVATKVENLAGKTVPELVRYWDADSVVKMGWKKLRVYWMAKQRGDLE